MAALAAHGFAALQMTDEVGSNRLQVFSPDHQVDQSRMEQRVRAVRILRRRDARGLLDHARPDESDLCARLGNQDVTKRGEAGGHAAKRGIGQYGYEGQLVAVVHGSRGRHFGHLHQRKHAFLHARAATGRHADQRNTPLRGFLEGMSDLFSHHRAHGAAQEREIENHQDRLNPCDAAKSGGDRFAHARLAPGVLQTHTIGFVICKTERIDGNQLAVQFAERPLVGKQGDARARRHRQIVAAFRADVEALFERRAGLRRAATGTLHRGRDGDFASEH